MLEPIESNRPIFLFIFYQFMIYYFVPYQIWSFYRVIIPLNILPRVTIKCQMLIYTSISRDTSCLHLRFINNKIKRGYRGFFRRDLSLVKVLLRLINLFRS